MRTAQDWVNWIIYGNDKEAKNKFNPIGNDRIFVEHCPYCKQERDSLNKDCEDQRFHKQK